MTLTMREVYIEISLNIPLTDNSDENFNQFIDSVSRYLQAGLREYVTLCPYTAKPINPLHIRPGIFVQGGPDKPEALCSDSARSADAQSAK